MRHAGNFTTLAAVAAIEEAQRKMREEEEMTHYSEDSILGDWEFKIVRSTAGRFRNPETFAQLLDEEAEFGWTLLEKLDDSRVRFKRNVRDRSRDRLAGSDRDPYRTVFGASDVRRAVVIGLGIAALILTIIFFLALVFGL